MTLGEFLRAEVASTTPWNCSTMPADWCVALGHPDFAAAWRTTIEPEACEAAQAAPGGLLALWEAGIGQALAVAEQPQPGDIAVVGIAGYEAGAIFTGERWATRGHRAVHFVAADLVAVRKAWRP